MSRRWWLRLLGRVYTWFDPPPPPGIECLDCHRYHVLPRDVLQGSRGVDEWWRQVHGL